MLGGLPYLLDNPRAVPIIAPNNSVHGEIHLNVVPCDPDGNEELNEDLMTDDPKDLIGNQLDFKVKIEKLTKLPEDFCRNIYCEYQFYTDDAVNKTPSCPEKNTDPIIGFVKHHTVECVSEHLLKYLIDDKLTIRIYGT